MLPSNCGRPERDDETEILETEIPGTGGLIAVIAGEQASGALGRTIRAKTLGRRFV
jgi:hypothetical protein